MVQISLVSLTYHGALWVREWRRLSSRLESDLTRRQLPGVATAQARTRSMQSLVAFARAIVTGKWWVGGVLRGV